MELHLRIVGGILILLAFIHVVFPRRFDWKSELSSLSLLNRQIMYVHTFFIALMVLLMGVFCIVSSADIINTRLGHQIALGLFLFWAIRLLFQFFVYSPDLWRGKPFETTIHVIFSFLWTYFSVVFFMIYWG
jgi:hypothetical protein